MNQDVEFLSKDSMQENCYDVECQRIENLYDTRRKMSSEIYIKYLTRISRKGLNPGMKVF